MSIEAPRHILILMSDQHRADCLGCAGHPCIKTPALDRLASEGRRFERAYTVSPVCMPARVSFLNARYPHNHGMWHNNGRMPADQDTFLQRLQGAGYVTSYIGKAHFYPNERGHSRDEVGYMKSRGLDHVDEIPGPWGSVIKQRSSYSDMLEEHGLWETFRKDYQGKLATARRFSFFTSWQSPLPTPFHLDAFVGDRAVEYVSRMSDRAPTCVSVSFGGPHEPWDPPGDYATRYRPEEMPHPLPADSGEAPPLANVLNMRAHYYGKISLIDDQIARILDAYEQRGLLDDLLIVYWADHGEMAGDHGRGGKTVFHEASARIPLLVRWPGRFAPGEVSDALVESIDVYPTLLEAAGVAPSDDCQGQSLVSVLRGETDRARDVVLSEVAGVCNGRRQRTYMVRTDRYKYAVGEDGEGFLLFDLHEDGDELNNLAGRPEARALEGEMRETLLRRLVATQTGLTQADGRILGPIV